MINRPTFAALSGLIDKPVTDNQGITVGHVTDILVDHLDGRIAYLQFRFDGDDGLQGRYITVPWSSIRPTASVTTGIELRVGRPTLEALVSGI